MKGFEMISNCPLVLKVLDTRPFLSQVGKSNWNQKSKEPKHCLKGGWACERAGPSSSSTSEKGLEGRVWPSVAQGMSLRWDLDTCPPASLLSLSQTRWLCVSWPKVWHGWGGPGACWSALFFVLVGGLSLFLGPAAGNGRKSRNRPEPCGVGVALLGSQTSIHPILQPRLWLMPRF